jgi:uncharacterized membrane protein YphA (DoxX/SURF4 family)
MIKESRAILALAVFRIGLGIIMIMHLLPLIKRVKNYHIADSVLYFPHRGWEWLPLLSEGVLLSIVGVSIVCMIAFTLGLMMRYTGLIASLTYLYFILIDKFYFNNHYYLLALMVALCAFTVADRSLSLRKDRVHYRTLISGEHYFVLRLMLCLVFFYGGIAKINPYWISGDVCHEILKDSPFGSGGFMTGLLTWGGLLFDLGIGFLLLIPRTRWIAFALALSFNVMNAIIFDDISWFPYFMIFSTVLFLPGMPVYDDRLRVAKGGKDDVLQGSKFTGGLTLGMTFFFAFQLLFPLRHYLLNGYSDWTGQGHYFSWRMKSFTKEASLDLYLLDKANPTSKQALNIGLDNYTIQRAAAMPDMVLRIAEYVADKVSRQGDTNFAILCDYKVNLNNQGLQTAIKPNVDLLELDYNMMRNNDWLLPWQPK